MDRRTYLAALTAGSLGGVTGCLESPPTLDAFSTPTPTPPPVDAPSLAEQGRPAEICSTDLVDLGIYAIAEPAFGESWQAIEIPEQYAETGRLAGDDVVIGVEQQGSARAYPVAVLWHHEIVNDPGIAAGPPILVTYCSLCRSGMVARRTLDDQTLTFGVTGQLWQPPHLQTRASEADDRVFSVARDDPDPGAVRNVGNLVMFDAETGSYWSQILARGICGPHTEETLSIIPSRTARWADWKQDHPETDILLPPPHSTLQDVPR